MANIVMNAAVSKIYEDKASGIATAIKEKSVIGFMDVRNITYQNKTRHIAGLKYDKREKTFFLTTPNHGDKTNLGIFISTYPVTIEHGVDSDRGKILQEVVLRDVYELPSVSAKFEIDGYEGAKNKMMEIFPKKVDFRILIVSGKKKVTLRNSKGILFTCDFDSGKWYVLRPGTSKSEIFRMDKHDMNISSIFRHDLPFPALDRKLFDKPGMIDFDTFDLKKHIIENV